MHTIETKPETEAFVRAGKKSASSDDPCSLEDIRVRSSFVLEPVSSSIVLNKNAIEMLFTVT